MDKPNKIGFWVLGAILFFILANFFFLSAPQDFPINSIVNIPEGASLRSVSRDLKNEHIIKSRILFEAFVIYYGGEKHIISTDYFFGGKESVWQVARRISRGEHNLAPVAVTIPEGFNVFEIADTFSLKLANFNKDKFLEKAKQNEGYLFPDTYFFTTKSNEEDALQLMSANFEKKVLSLEPEIILSGKTEKEIIIMASIIEREAKGDADRGLISGILWKRLAIGMALQADAAPETYKTRGLPKSPICNPGLEAIKAGIHPEKSDYLYYLHGKDGNIHYAKNFTEHQANIAKYLK